MTTPPPGAGLAQHHALFYDRLADYTSGIVSFVEEGLAASESVLVVLPGPALRTVRGELPGAGGGVTFLDMVDVGANPARLIPAMLQFAAARPGRWRAVGECMWPGRTPAESREVARHEALANLAFVAVPAVFLCPYDISRLSEAVVADAARTHPHIRERGRIRPSPEYGGVAVAEAIAAEALSAAPVDAARYAFGHPDDLPTMRRHVRRAAVSVGLARTRVEEAVLAVNELATNVLVHGRGGGVVRTWREPGVLICEVTGAGRITDPLAGRHPPAASRDGPHGLWLVNQVCDLTEQRTGPTGTTTRVHLRVR